MPYWIRRPVVKSQLAIGIDFEPIIDHEIKRRLSLGRELTENELAQIPGIISVGEVPKKGIPDIIGWGNGPYLLSQSLRDKIEELEAAVHRFIPIHVVSKNINRTDYGIFYLLHLTQALDAVVPEKTHFREGVGLDAAKVSVFSLNPWQGPYVLDNAIIDGRHLWRGAGPGDRWNDYYCSDVLGEFIKENKFCGWKLVRCEVK